MSRPQSLSSERAARWPRRVATIVVTLGALLATGAASHAHSGFQSYVYVSLFATEIDGRVEYPVADLGPAIGIDFPEDASGRLELARERIDDIVAYTDEHLDLGPVDGTAWELEFRRDPTMLETAAGDYLQVWFEVREDFTDVPRTFVTTYDGIIESNPERDALFIVENDWDSATFANEGDHLLGFSIGAETQTIVVDEVGSASAVYEVGRLGSIAVDRSLVVLVALIGVMTGALLGDRRRARGDRRTGPDRAGSTSGPVVGLRRVAERVGVFAAAAIASCALLGIGGIDVSTRLTFGAAAAGVLVAAATIWLAGRTSRIALVVCGLLVGAVLAEQFTFLQLERGRPVLATISFAVGALVTLAVVTAMLLPIGLLVRRVVWAGTAAAVAAAVVVVAGTIWVTERIIGVKFPLREAELLVADVVTNPIVLAVATVAVLVVTVRPTTTSDPSDPSVASGDHPDAELATSSRIEA